jgi:2-polyprenyl-3-methyl-5-hydroxy-6-metoxy-1,4-benzoquinol methylase
MSAVFDYDSIPIGYYDEVHSRDYGIQSFWHREKFRQVASRITMDPSTRILDLACGPGTFIGNYITSGVAHGVDVASSQILYAQNKYSRAGLTFRQVTETARLSEEGVFDVIVMIEFLEHISPDASATLLREAISCLQDGGEIIATTPNYRSSWPVLEWAIERFARGPKYNMQHVQHWTKETLRHHLEASGYRVMELTGIIGVTPFFAPFSRRLAQWVARIEASLARHWGFSYWYGRV